MTLYAKSDGTTLEQHTRHVVSAMKGIARFLLPGMKDNENQTVVHGAILHDLGKGHPIFQAMLGPKFDWKTLEYEVPHRHEISSLLFLPLFSQAEWLQIIDMVVAHHKPISLAGNEKGRGLIDLVNEYGENCIFDRHAEGWEAWHREVFKILPAFDVLSQTISREQARAAFDFALSHCEQHRFGRNSWRGLLMAADHLASALQEGIDPRLDSLFRVPDLSEFHRRSEKASKELYPLAKKPSNSPKPHTLVIASTGSGKTDYLLRRCNSRRVFYLLPFQASINAMFLRFEHLLNEKDGIRLSEDRLTDIRRVHSASQIAIDGAVEEEVVLQRHVGAGLKVMTPHQMAALVFGLPGHEAIALDVAGQDIVLDEVHVYSEQAQAMVLELVKALVKLDCRVHIGSATIPDVLASELRKCLGGEQCVHEVRLTDEELTSYDRHIVYRLNDENAAREFIAKAVSEKKRILFLANRVARAQERFEWVRRMFPNIPVLLVHSRYRRGDRAQLEQQIELFDKKNGPCIVCATQVVEVSLDISFDTLVTDCAPLDSLIQRFGRVNRVRKPTAEKILVPVGVIAPPTSDTEALPYRLSTLQKTWNALPDENVLRETDLQQRINTVFSDLVVLNIDTHLVEDETGFKLPELWNFPRSLILDVLEIDSAVVVRASDAEAYKSAHGDNRQNFEIPVPIGALRSYVKTWRQLLDVGHRPFICPDACYDETLGLQLGQEGKIGCIIL